MKPANRDPSGLRNDRRSAVSLAWDSWRWRGNNQLNFKMLRWIKSLNSSKALWGLAWAKAATPRTMNTSATSPTSEEPHEEDLEPSAKGVQYGAF